MFDSFASVDAAFCINAQGGRAASILMYCSLLPASEIFLDGRHKDIPIDRFCSPSPRCRPDQFLHLAPCLAAVRAGSFGQLGYFAPRGLTKTAQRGSQTACRLRNSIQSLFFVHPSVHPSARPLHGPPAALQAPGSGAKPVPIPSHAASGSGS